MAQLSRLTESIHRSKRPPLALAPFIFFLSFFHLSIIVYIYLISSFRFVCVSIYTDSRERGSTSFRGKCLRRSCRGYFLLMLIFELVQPYRHLATYVHPGREDRYRRFVIDTYIFIRCGHDSRTVSRIRRITYFIFLYDNLRAASKELKKCECAQHQR